MMQPNGVDVINVGWGSNNNTTLVNNEYNQVNLVNFYTHRVDKNVKLHLI
jgi:hypothetical protein